MNKSDTIFHVILSIVILNITTTCSQQMFGQSFSLVEEVTASEDSTCGLANGPSSTLPTSQNATVRILGGVATVPNEFPWQAFMLIRLPDGDISACGGSLIHPRWILTAAHCVDGAELVKIFLGIHNITDILTGETDGNPDEPHRESYLSNSFFIHPRWNDSTFQGDIALIKLPSPVTYTDYVRPICLPKYDQVMNTTDHVGDPITLTGWGKTSGNSNVNSVLLKAQTVVISMRECNNSYYPIITDSIICSSGAGNRGTCSGDSGGPMNFQEPNGTWTQIGIVSFGRTGCVLGEPNGFTRVQYYASWISETMLANLSMSIHCCTKLYIIVILVFFFTYFRCYCY